MDCGNVGVLIFRLRKGKDLTQKRVADRMNPSDKTISKWERGSGYPDASLPGENLSNQYDVNIGKIPNGNLKSNAFDSGNFRRLKFYIRPAFGDVIANTGNAEISAVVAGCHSLLSSPLTLERRAMVESTGGESYVPFHHKIEKDHSIALVAYVTNVKPKLVDLYPEQGSSERLPKVDRYRTNTTQGFIAAADMDYIACKTSRLGKEGIPHGLCETEGIERRL